MARWEDRKTGSQELQGNKNEPRTEARMGRNTYAAGPVPAAANRLLRRA